MTHTNQWLSRNLEGSTAQCWGCGACSPGGPTTEGTDALGQPQRPRAGSGDLTSKPPSTPAFEAQGLTGKAQAPDEVEEKEGSQDAIERDVRNEEAGIVADGPGQVLQREIRLDVGLLSVLAAGRGLRAPLLGMGTRRHQPSSSHRRTWPEVSRLSRFMVPGNRKVHGQSAHAPDTWPQAAPLISWDGLPQLSLQGKGQCHCPSPT